MIGPAQVPLAIEGGGSLAEAIVIFLGLCAYALPRLLKAFQDRRAEQEQSSESGDEVLPGRRSGRGAPQGGGAFVDPKRAARQRRKETLARWQELLIGEEPEPAPKRKVVPVPKARPTATSAERPSPTLVELGHSIDELHEALEQRHAQIEETHEGLPGAWLGSSLGSPALSAAPAEDEFETLVDYAASAGAIAAPNQVDRTSRRLGTQGAWRQAVVLSELFGAPVALRSPSESPGRMPG